MRRDEVERNLEGMIDELAHIEHERWSHWQKYMHSKGELQPDGSILIPAELVERWQRQLNTRFVDLSAEEQESDREQVRKYLPTIVEGLGSM